MEILISLSKAIEMAEVEGKLEELHNRLRLFHSAPGGHDEELFLEKNAIPFETSGKARTYMVIKGNDILGFFSLSVKSIDLADVSKTKVKNMTAGETNARSYASYLIGHLARSASTRAGYGETLFNHAMALIEKAQRIVGGRIVYLDCKDIQSLRVSYEKRGFSYFRTSPQTGLCQYYMKLLGD